MNYKTELTRVMSWLGQKEDVVFIGQNIIYGGNLIFDTLKGVPMEKRIELPVAEEMQMGMSIGLALTGKTVISIYPRFDFLLCAINQLVNHLDKLEEFTHNEFHAKVIVRVGIGSRKPMYPGVQHCGDYTNAIFELTKNINIARITRPEQALFAYQTAYEKTKRSTLIVEEMDLYKEEE